MKKIIILTISVFLINACKPEKLDVAPTDQLSSATFWRNESDATNFVTGVYDKWSSAHAYQVNFADVWSDNLTTGSSWRGYYYYVWGSANISALNGDLNGFWGSIYTVVRSANLFLSNAGKCQMDDALRNRLIGEVKFIRAFEYFLGYYTWGEMPIVDKPLSIDELNIERPATGTTLAFILKDLDEAIANLPTKAPNIGRITKGAALALKARILLYEGKYAEAATTAKSVMDMGYGLLRTGKGDGYYQLRNTTQMNNSEAILGWMSKYPERPNDIYHWTTGNLYSPTKSIVDTYDSYDRKTDKIVPVDNKTTTGMFDNRDPRLNWSIGHTGTIDPIQSSTTYNTALDSEASPLKDYATGYMCLKFANDNLINNVGYDVTDNILIRYAEVLLTYAEAKIEANQIDQSVLDAINEVRSRAWGTTRADVVHYPEVTATDQATLRAEVRKERRVELAFEGLRWYDLKRWKIAAGTNGVMNGKDWGARKKDGTYIDAGSRNLSDDHYYLRPIPQAQIDLSQKKLAQNSGY